MKILIAIITLALATSVHANLIGEITFTGHVTTNHLYNFNDPGSQPLGTFGPQTVSTVSGIFDGHVSVGDILGGTGILNTVNGPTFTLPGLTFTTPLGVAIAGAGFVNAFMDITGLELPPDFTFASWFFNLPGALDVGHDITGPIVLELVAYDDHFPPAPDGGSTVLLFAGALVGLFWIRRKGVS